MDPRGILTQLERIWDLIDAARVAQEPRSETPPDNDAPFELPLPDYAPFEVALSDEDLPFILARLDEGNAVTRQILAEVDLHPEMRREQEESLELGLSAAAEVRRLVTASQ